MIHMYSLLVITDTHSLSLVVPLSQIQKVLSGRSTDSFKLHQLEHDDNCCFSIIYTEDSNTKTLDLVATTPHEANLWVNGLLTLTLSGMTTCNKLCFA